MGISLQREVEGGLGVIAARAVARDQNGAKGLGRGFALVVGEVAVGFEGEVAVLPAEGVGGASMCEVQHERTHARTQAPEHVLIALFVQEA